MEKKILIGSIIAVGILIILSSSVVGYESIQSNSVKEPPISSLVREAEEFPDLEIQSIKIAIDVTEFMYVYSVMKCKVKNIGDSGFDHFTIYGEAYNILRPNKLAGFVCTGCSMPNEWQPGETRVERGIRMELSSVGLFRVFLKISTDDEITYDNNTIERIFLIICPFRIIYPNQNFFSTN